MKKIAVFLALFLSTGVYASEQVMQLDFDADSLPDCSQLSEEVIFGHEAYTCVSKRNISDEELVKEHLFDYEVAANSEKSQFISLNKLNTQLTLHNKGGYNARMIVTHYQANPIDGVWNRFETTTKSIPVGTKTSVTVPGNTVSAEARLQRHGALRWETIATDSVTPDENRWVANDNSKNIMQWDVWGTIFNSPHAQVQPAGTYDYYQ
ncbi:MAG: hypothetical protein ACRCWB_02900 [Enterovibrio sp.]